MSVPGWYQLVLLALAAYRSWRLLAVDEVLDEPRATLLDRAPWLQKWIYCPWCCGFWVSLAWWGAWEAWPRGTLVAAAPMAASLLVGLIAKNLDP